MSMVTEDVVFLDRGNYTTCTIHLHGGTILSYRVKNKEILYMKKKTAFNHFSAIRGGIKLTFPYFGRRINGPKHGFARDVPWILEEGPTVNDDGNVEAVLSFRESEYTKSIWNYKFKISMTVTLCMDELRMAVKVQNTCKYFPFCFTILRYGIFKVMDVENCEVYGLSNCKHMSYKSDLKELIDPDPESDKVVIRKACLDLYVDAPPKVEVRNIDNNCGLKLKITSFDPTTTDVLVYNPWEGDDSDADDQHFMGEYKNILGVGTGHLSSNIRLEPQESWESRLVIEVANEEYEKRIDELAKLLDNPLTMFKNVCVTTDTYLSKK